MTYPARKTLRCFRSKIKTFPDTMEDPYDPMDGEETIPTGLKAQSERIYFGSLEEQEKKRIEELKGSKENDGKLRFEGGVIIDNEATEKGTEKKKSASKAPLKGIEAAIASGNIQRVGPTAETYALSVGSQKERDAQESKYTELLQKRRAKALAVPTNPSEVKERLRDLGEPITLFGERELERRERLREILVKLEATGQLEPKFRVEKKGKKGEKDGKSAKPSKPETFYTEGSLELQKARQEIALFSIPRARDRLRRAREKRESPDEDEDEEIQAVLREISKCTVQSSEIGDSRPLSSCSISSDSSLLATSSWSGTAKIWGLPAVNLLETLKVE